MILRFLVASVVLLTPEFCSADDKDQLQGEWFVLVAEVGGKKAENLRGKKLVVKGDEWTLPAGGTRKFKIDAAKSQVCYELHASGIGAATMAHIHKAPADAAGPVAIPLKAPDASGKVSECTTADAAVVNDILHNPAAYYVNIHNAQFPAGAIRGQLSK